MTRIGDRLAGRYRLDELVGAGGMATVYRAHDERLDRAVAIKVLSPNLAADDVTARRFEQEARFLASVTHPAIVSVFDVGEADGTPFFVMELIQGQTLGDRLARVGRLAPAEVVRVVSDVASGLAVLHREGFVHRDVKPDNVLLSADGPAKLTDFGLVRGDDPSELTAPGTTVGTLSYLAPELLRGERATPASDVYALGVLTYQALAGRLPYPATTLAGLVEGAAAAPPSPSSVSPDIPPAFDRPILSALAHAGRPDVEAFASSLRAAVAQDVAVAPDLSEATTAVRATPISPSETAAREERHYDRTVPALVALLALIVGALLVTFVSGSPRSAAAPTQRSTPTRSPSPVATVARQPTPADAVIAALDAFRNAVEASKGGKEGLKGKEANELIDLANGVERAARDGDTEDARDSARELARQADRAAEGLRSSDARRLRDAAQAVVAAASRLVGEG